MSSSETVEDKESKEKIKTAARHGQLNDIIELSTKFTNDVKLLSEILIESCFKGYLNVVKWTVQNTAVDVNYIVEL